MKIPHSDLKSIFWQVTQKNTLAPIDWVTSGRDGAEFFLVTATPKSGSTWATNVLGASLDCLQSRYCYAHSSNEHDLYPPALVALGQVRTISQLHCKATPNNVRLMLDFNFRTVVISRNAYDAVVSFAKDLMVKAAQAGSSPGVHGYSFVWLTNVAKDADLDYFIEYALDYFLPWYVNFLASWDDYTSLLSPEFVRYEKLLSEPIGSFSEVLSKLDQKKFLKKEILEVELEVPSQSMSKSPIGWGYNRLTIKQKARIEDFLIKNNNKFIASHLEIY